jgi:hypothetical protein
MTLLHNGTMRGGPRCVEVPNQGGPQAEPRLCTQAGPNQALEPTPYSLRSFLASASGRGSPLALDAKKENENYRDKSCLLG